MNQPIDIFITCFERSEFTRQTLKYLKERTTHPYRLFIINNGGNEDVLREFEKDIFLVITPNYNIGIHAAWNIALGLAESDYFITSDNDIYVPDLQPDWLTQLITFMDERPDFGAISLHPHVLIGAVGFEPNAIDDVREVNMCGAVMRIMRRQATYQAGGWDKFVRSQRNHEERTICSRLQTAGYKVGRTTKLRAYHPFGKGIGGNWGYKDIPPEVHGHNPQLRDYVISFDNVEAYDEKTWLPK
jgi:GT2 family glycosyltransferase